ncbi:NAD(+) synthase [Candidatus Allofournierella excrementavium]|uniref:NAD(+) synthase n=1 Tax=Candidatus Allofournierella excrementavium TaxID=2838591 RepID=UPI003A8573A6
MTSQLLTVAAAAPRVHIAAPEANAREMLALAVENADASVILFPELAITGYTCADLFGQTRLLEASRRWLNWLAKEAWDKGVKGLLAVGAPVPADNQLFNCLVLLHGGAPVAVVPKSCLPNYGEFYEKRWFAPASARLSDHVLWPLENGECIQVPFGEDLLVADRTGAVVLAAEICEDLWAPVPPSGFACLAGADVILNPSASNETVTKSDYRRQLVKGQSARCDCVYVYAGAGDTESTTDLVFSGHGMICENGRLLAEQLYPAPGSVIRAVVDVERVRTDRLRHGSYMESIRPAPWRTVRLAADLIDPAAQGRLLAQRPAERLPFVPDEPEKLDGRCAEIARIQATGLARRLAASGAKRAVIGLSGGLDSTLAFLAALQAMESLGRPAADVLAVSMPCVGTTQRTFGNAAALAQLTGAEYREVPIKSALEGHLKDIGHSADLYDTTFENAQARERTQILMDLANQEGGIVVGTGDLSELALGWCTYNGDHMSMYGVNASIPKTLVKAMVAWHARRMCDEHPHIPRVLLDILDTPISPELLPVGQDGALVQKTEEALGKYDLHDFALYHMLRGGYSPQRILEMACIAYPEVSRQTVRATLKTFYRRFFTQQFKRSCLPDGPKVGSVSLSPRGDWRMPSDAEAAEFLEFE